MAFGSYSALWESGMGEIGAIFESTHSKASFSVEEDLSKGILEAVDLDSYRVRLSKRCQFY